MSEFCLKCFNDINGTEVCEDEVLLSEDAEFCEGCGEMERVVISSKRNNRWQEFFRRMFSRYRD
ncbi:hypothetical protein LJC10_05005 [Selenomonadales bacterium OttesenSCG-928-I06]|nr:hypothetical protein [Selenomonadales bacterium OttesenSCG-928-I06]